MSFSALEWIVGIVFAASAFYTAVNLKLKSQKGQIDGVGKKARDIESENLRRWLQMIYTQLMIARDLEDVKQIAEQLRQEAYRK